jgi:hypothetical protein
MMKYEGTQFEKQNLDVVRRRDQFTAASMDYCQITVSGHRGHPVFINCHFEGVHFIGIENGDISGGHMVNCTGIDHLRLVTTDAEVKP